MHFQSRLSFYSYWTVSSQPRSYCLYFCSNLAGERRSGGNFYPVNPEPSWLEFFQPITTGRKNGFTRVAKLQQMCSKYHICTILLKFAQEQRLDLLSVAMTVNATFAQHLQLGAKVMGSRGFEVHLQMVQMCRQICFFELYLHIMLMIARICCFVQLLL